MTLNTTDALIVVQIVSYGIGIGVLYGVIKTRLDQLEKKQDKHNNLIERVYKLEGGVVAIWRKLDEVCEDIKERRSHE
jgi:CRISPR/Cas system CSM-associated protein Csm2 small subunit